MIRTSETCINFHILTHFIDTSQFRQNNTQFVISLKRARQSNDNDIL